MSYLVDTTDLKKKFCNHEFKRIYPQGSTKALDVCGKCKKIIPIEIKNEKLIQYMSPAFEQSDIDVDDEWRFLTNYMQVNHNGLTIAGVQKEHYWCNTWHTKGCNNFEAHEKCGRGKKMYLKQYKKSCFRAVCKKCYRRWMARSANRGTRRIEKYAKLSERDPIHVILSIPQRHYHLSEKKLREIAVIIAKEIGLIGGAIIFHPFRKKHGTIYYSPHFHVIAFGTTVRREISYYKYNWVIIDKGFRKSVFGTFYYNLGHCGIKKGIQSVIWFGDLSYSKLRLEKEPNSNTCPACGDKLVPLFNAKFDSGIPPGQIFEGFVDPEGWCIVKTDMYCGNYSVNCRLYYANTGIDIMS